MTNIVDRVAFEWEFICAGGKSAWDCIVGGEAIGRITVTEQGKFKAKHRMVWLSSSTYAEYVPYDTLDDAKQAIALRELEARRS